MIRIRTDRPGEECIVLTALLTEGQPLRTRDQPFHSIGPRLSEIVLSHVHVTWLFAFPTSLDRPTMTSATSTTASHVSRVSRAAVRLAPAFAALVLLSGCMLFAGAPKELDYS